MCVMLVNLSDHHEGVERTQKSLLFLEDGNHRPQIILAVSLLQVTLDFGFILEEFFGRAD